ncbi:GntR family transcriptional regulator [Roseovarius sp. Pro17]|uniref:GntR family transcriptional regulator n=1 Tax=Roseovarius sp. Pro17 TaxID=3108175 RepID=UPI002D7A1152|nr:GntR family transcriptional regulator [Roseovarius sp. Pro17]
MRNIKPRYVDIAETLERELVELSPNSLLPTEEQMSKRFEVSRITVRAALELLENSGQISRMRGRGTIVSPKKLVRTFSPFLSFEADMKSHGIDFKTQVLSFEKSVTAPPKFLQQLELPAGSLVTRLSLVRLVEEQVICHDQRYYPDEIGNKIDPAQAETKACSEIIQNAIGEKIRRVRWDSEILSSSQDVAAALGLANRALVFTSNYTWFAKKRRPIETGLVSYRVDRCKFRFEERLRDDMSDDDAP